MEVGLWPDGDLANLPLAPAGVHDIGGAGQRAAGAIGKTSLGRVEVGWGGHHVTQDFDYRPQGCKDILLATLGLLPQPLQPRVPGNRTP